MDRMEHLNCRELEDIMAEEIRRQSQVIKAYRNMLLSLNMSATILDDIEDEFYKKN